MWKNVLGFPAMPMDPVLAHSPRLWKYSSWFFFPSPPVIEAVKMDANMTSEGHHFSVACQILLLWTQPGPGAVLTSCVDRSSEFEVCMFVFCPLVAAPRLRWPRHGPRRRRPAATQWRRLRHILQDPKQRTEGREETRRNSDQIQEIMWNQHQVLNE